MRLGIMQPYFFPYLGYFGLLQAVDQWIVFDTPQYIRRGWVNRNRILTSGQAGWKYIKIPVQKASRDTPINRIEVSQHDWRTDILRQLDYYQHHHAPYFRLVTDFLHATFTVESSRLSCLLVHFLQRTCELLEIRPQRFSVFSEMNLPIGPVTHPGEWALRISEAVHAECYINPIGGRDIFTPGQFDDLGIELQFFDMRLTEYDQQRETFIPGLSVIDSLMWLGPAGTRDLLTDSRIVHADIDS